MKYINRTALTVILALLAIAVTANSATIHVPADQPTIQAGIDAATSGDTILVADGTYTGDGNRDIDFSGKNIVLMSMNGPAVTIIDCQGDSLNYHRGFNFHSGENLTAVVDGFTILNGYEGPGGGIYCNGSSPTISNNIIRGNSSVSYWFEYGRGGGIYCILSSPIISNNTIRENSASYYGGGIYCASNSNPMIIDNTISDNIADWRGGGLFCQSDSLIMRGNVIIGNSASDRGGGVYTHSSGFTMSGNVIVSNQSKFGGGMFCYGTSPTIINSTICANTAYSGSGIEYTYDTIPVIINTVVAFNSTSVGTTPIKADLNSGSFLVCCNVYGNVGGDWGGEIADQAGLNGNFSADPLFCDTAGNDYSLSTFSPCLSSSPFNTCDSLIGALDFGCDGNYVCADANNDSLVNLTDVIFLQAYYFECDTPPFPFLASDLNCDGSVDIGDIVYLSQYLNGNGPEPCCMQ